MTGPQRIGAYRIERLLGAGSFATVWLGSDPALGGHVAIKVLAENWSHDLRVRERFAQEARLMWGLADERVVRVHAVGELPDGRPYQVMEFADGGSLRDRLSAGELTRAEGLAVLREVAAGVAVLHRERIVHRDLTPGNVLFAGGRVLIADLGLAKALAAASGLTARAGTPGYMAPEQDDPMAMVDTAADVYALGRLGMRLGLPPECATVLRVATARDPRRRYPDAAAFAVALDRAVRKKDRSRIRAGWLVVAGAVLTAIPSDVVRPEGIRTAGEGTGRLTVVLPDGWRGAGSGWAGRFDAQGERDPALVISPDPGRWPTDPGMPGAFVGLARGTGTTTAAFVAARPHASCRAAPVRRSRQGGVDWVIARFACITGKPVIVEAAGPVPGGILYVQATPGAQASDQVIDALLAGVRVD